MGIGTGERLADKISVSLKLLIIALYVVPMASSAGDEESKMCRGGEIVGYLGSSPDPGCQFPAFISPKNSEERSMCSL